jgi:hypothetical protein
MPDTIVLPPRLIQFAQALRPLHARLERNLKASRPEINPCPDLLSALQGYLEKLSRSVSQLAACVNGELAGAVADVYAGEWALTLAMRHLEHGLDAGIDSFTEVAHLRVSPADEQGKAILLAVHRHFLGQLSDWMGQLLEALDHPAVVMERRGIKAEGTVVLDFDLILSNSPALTFLETWGRQRVALSAAAIQTPFVAAPKTSSGPGFFTSLVIAWMGLEIFEHLFHDDHCDRDS